MISLDNWSGIIFKRGVDNYFRQSLWNMVRDARMKSTDFLQLCQRQLSLESNAKILGTIVENAMGAMGFVPNRVFLNYFYFLIYSFKMRRVLECLTPS